MRTENTTGAKGTDGAAQPNELNHGLHGLDGFCLNRRKRRKGRTPGNQEVLDGNGRIFPVVERISRVTYSFFPNSPVSHVTVRSIELFKLAGKSSRKRGTLIGWSEKVTKIFVLLVLCAICGRSATAQTRSTVVVSNATGVLVAPGNFFAANSNLLNQAVNKFQPGLTNPVVSSTPFNGVAETLYSPYSLLEYNMTNASVIFPVYQTGAQGIVEEEFSFGGLGYFWNRTVTSNAYQVNDVNNHIALQLTNTGGTNNAKIGGNLAVGGVLSGSGSGLSNVAIPGGFLSVLQNGAVGDGSTDDTAAVQACLSKGGCWEFGTNAYYLRELVLTNNTTLHGNWAHLIYATGATNTNIFISHLLNSNISWTGSFWIDGRNYSDITTRSYNGFNSYAGGAFPFVLGNNNWQVNGLNYWRACGLRHGLQINAIGGGDISGLVISGFNGCGVIPLETNWGQPQSWFGPANSLNPVHLHDITCYTNTVGFYSSSSLGVGNGDIGYSNPIWWMGGPNWITNYVPGSIAPQYMTYMYLNLWGNSIGLVNTAANNAFIGCEFTGNYWHEVDSGSGVNNMHGICQGCFYNHSLYQDMYITGIAQSGQTYSGCWFAGNAGGAITIYNCRGISFNDCHWDTGGIFLTNSGTQAGCVNFVRNFSYGGAWSGSGIGTDGRLVLEGGYSFDTQPDPVCIGIAATGVTNLGPRQATAIVTASAATFYVTNFYKVCVQTNTSATGTWQIPLRYGESVNAASGLGGYLYW